MNHDVYVLIPGITGSVLQKDGHDVFGLTAQAGLRALFTGGGSIQQLRLTEDPPDVDDLGDGIRAGRLAADAHLIPGLWKIDGYGKVGAYLRHRLRLLPGESYFEFPYDWRRDNRVAARQLAAQAQAWLRARRTAYPDARLVLVAHSMGGLVARYYLEVLGGWRDTRTLLTFGTPYRGSVKALDFLANGLPSMLGLAHLSDLLCSFTSIYQLLPIYRCLDRGDGNLVRLTEAPGLIPSLDPGKVTAARAFHREIEDAVDRHHDDSGFREDRYQIRPVVGIDQPTNQSAIWRERRLTVLRSYEGKDLEGDGTVPRVSAFPQEVEVEEDSDAMYASTRHASLQNTDAVLTQVRGWTTGAGLRRFRAGAPISLTLDLEDAYPGGAKLRASVLPAEATSDLLATLEWVAGPGNPGRTVSAPLPAEDGPRAIEFAPPAPGCYRLKVSGANDVEPVTDLFVVAPE